MRTSATKLLALMLMGLLGGTAGAAPPATVEFLNSGKVYPAGVPLAEAVRVGGTLYLSGQIGVVPGSLRLVPGALGAQVEIDCIAHQER